MNDLGRSSLNYSGGGKPQLLCVIRQGGFTLVEMLTVVGIIAVLVSVSIPVVNSSLKKAQEATDAANERAAKSAAMTQYLLTESMGEVDASGFSYFDNAAGKWKKDPPSAKYGKCEVHNHKGCYLKGWIENSEVKLVWTDGTNNISELCSEKLMADSSGGAGGVELEQLTLPSDCAFTVQIPKDSDKSKVSFNAGVLTINSDEKIIISSGGTQTSNRIRIADGVNANITLKDVNIVTSEGAAFEITDNSKGNVTVTFNGSNILKSGSNCAGLQKNGDDTSGTLTISGEGSLTATGGQYGAGIGGGNGGNGSNIKIIDSKSVYATSGVRPDGATGIGGGNGGAGSHITIERSTVEVNGASSAGIGGGGKAGTDITIRKSNVTINHYGTDIGGTNGGVSERIFVNDKPYTPNSNSVSNKTTITPTSP